MTRKQFRFVMSCVGIKDDDDLRELDKMIRDEMGVSWRTFSKWVPIEEIRKMFPTYSYRQENEGVGFHIKDDRAVSFHKSKFWGQRVYYLVHSGVEYIFADTDSFWDERAREKTILRYLERRGL